MKRLVIEVFRHGTLTRQQYYMRNVAMLLAEEGIEVRVVHGPGPHVDADLAVLHVDLTVVPDDHMEFLKGYRIVLNGKVSDISKRRVSRLRLDPGDDHDGPVIVKANRNCGGRPEAALAQQGLLPGKHRVIREYPVLNSVREVSQQTWNDPDLVVERFAPEVVDGVYRLRMWKFLGDAETNTIAYSRSPVAKGSNIFHREEGGTVPQELREIREELGYDYGKFDYGIVNGKVMFYDANRTPTFSRPLEEEMPRIRAFAEALKRFALR